MKYRYKQTGIIVESGDMLDPATYTPVTENSPGKEEAEPEKEKIPAKKTTSRNRAKTSGK